MSLSGFVNNISTVNPKDLEVGSVAYYMKRVENLPFVVRPAFGIVEEHYPTSVVLQLIEPLDTRKIGSVPYECFVTPSPWKKLPKGWAYDTKLFEVTTNEAVLASIKYDLRDPQSILDMYKAGLLVDVQSNDHTYPTTEISREYGWRIVRDCLGKEPNSHVSVDWRVVYKTYDDCLKACDEYNAEYDRQANLSDYDWSVEQIDKTLDCFAAISNIPDEDKKKYRDFLLAQENVEDICVRIYGGNFQWKYEKNHRWNDINIV